MKETLRTLCSPILKPFESGDEPYVYKPLNRKILLVMSFLFLALSTAVFLLAPEGSGMSYLFPGIVFGTVGLACLIVGALGNDRAVAKIWGNR